MADTQDTSKEKTVEKNSRGITWTVRPDITLMRSFRQTPPIQAGGLPSGIAPHELFNLFTSDIIREKKVFIR